MTSFERRSVAMVALVLALRLFGLFVLLPVLALYAGDLPGGTPLLAGIAVGAYGITQALLQVPAGLLSDRIGRKQVIVIGLFIFAIGSVIAATSDSIAGIIAGRVLQGAGAISAAVTALAADLTRDEVRTRVMAIVGISVGLSFLAALALGPQLADRFGVSGLFWLGAGFAVLAAVIISAGPGDWAPPVRHESVKISDALLDTRLLPLNLGVFLLHGILTATFVAVPYLLRDELGLAAAGHSRIYIIALLASVIGTVPLILAVERSRKPMVVLMIAIALLGVGQLALLNSASAVGVMVALAVFFAGFNFLEARLPATLSQLAGSGVRGGAFGVFATSQFLGAFAGGLAGGVALGYGGWPVVATGCALASLVWLAIAGISR